MPVRFDASDQKEGKAAFTGQNYVKLSLGEVYNNLYKRVMSVPGRESSELPLVLKQGDDFVDQFSLEVNYSHYPLLFCDLFPELDEKKLPALCVISQLYAESQVQLDNFIDNQLHAQPDLMKTVILTGSQYKLAFAIRKLSELLGDSDFFWSRFDHFFGDYLCQILEEKTKEKYLELPSLQDMERSAIGKVSMVKIITAAMAELAGRKELLPALEESQDLFAIGYQLYDDVKDWKKDLTSSRYSYLLKKAFNEFEICVEIKEGKIPAPVDLGSPLYFSDLLPDTLELAASYIERAKSAVDGMDCPGWISWLEMQQNSILRLRLDLIEIRARAIERARLKAVSKKEMPECSVNLKSCDQALIKGITFLQDQEQKDYLEARHLEMTGKRGMNIEEPACYWGSVFQRAVTLHSLALARQAGFFVNREIFEADLKVLIDSRLKSRKGGWSYFPDWQHLPPDCDDLAEVLHVLIALSHPETSKLCEDPLELALHGQKRDGSISTWIADPADESSLGARDFMHEIWGSQPDAEVMANLLYALWKYDCDRFRDNISAGTSYLAGRQNSDGSWTSTWYEGLYYGTWVCCRHLAAAGGFDDNLSMAKSFLLKTQRKDGGWDTEGVLNTAYALLTLAGNLNERNPELIFPAARKILSLQRVDGSWSESPFIKMKTLGRESMPGKESKPFFYGSCTMSTAFAVRALLALKKLIQ